VLELEELNRNLDVLRGVGKKKEILAPLGENTFVRAELKDSEKVLVHAGAKVMVDRNIAEAKEMNRKQMDELNAFLEQMKADLLRMFSEQERLTSELEGSLHQ
jgi:prefoldin alpha subunit